MVANCLDHDFPAGLATRVAVGVELVDEPMCRSVQPFEVARQVAKLLLQAGLVSGTRPVAVMGLELLGQWNSLMSKVYLRYSPIFYKSKASPLRG